MEAVFGDMLAREEHGELKKTYGMYEMMVSIVSVVLFSVTAVMIIPFVRLYTANLTDANYIEPLFAIVLTAASLLYCLRMPAHSLIIAAGHFKQTRVAAYGETVINLLLSVILVFKFGIVGVAVGTLVATLFRFIYYAVYLGKNILNQSVLSFAVRQLINALIFTALVASGYFAVSRLEIGSYISWVLISIAVTAISLIVVGAANGLCYPKDFKQMLIFLFNKRK
jgi:O-antigen/teichoic acid export membrane protein